MADEEIFGGSGGINERGFLFRSVLFRVKTEAEAQTVGPVTWLGVPQKKGGRTWVPQKGGAYHVTVIYEGLVEEPDPEAPENFTWLPSRSEEAIETHPESDKMVEDYLGTLVESKLVFPMWMTPAYKPGAGGLPGRDPNKLSGLEKNPMFGRESYLSQSGVWRWSLTTKNKPSAWIAKNGKVVKSVPGGLETPDNHDWLVMFGPMVARGSGDSLGYESTIDFLLSEKGGWPPSQWILNDA